MFKTEQRPGLVYAESRDEEALQKWASLVGNMEKMIFKCVLPPTRAPVRDDRPTKVYGERFKEFTSMTGFGEELVRRGLADWWRSNEAFKGKGSIG
ncbi:hypothetical protein JX266_009621 [Neoarthrinium moseri]|nr:hypothetical protein JX266_009621 [Neoarthrinium moseri]